jgi:hypothetical protein
MKKVLLLVLVIASTFAASAQTEKGTWLLGGNANFHSSKSSGSSSTTFVSITPNIGYFICDDLAVGGMADFYSESDYQTDFNIGPFVRYYFLPIGTNAKLFGQGSIGFGSNKYSGESSLGYTKWALAAGPAFFLSPTVALETTLYYSSSKDKGFSAYNSFGVNVGFQIHLKRGKK